jgi:hypothetical protein
VSNFENDAFFAPLRYDIQSNSAQGLVFLKTMDCLKTSPLDIRDMISFFEEREDILSRHPLTLLNAVLEFTQRRAHEFVRWRVALNDMESRLGVTRNAELLKLGVMRKCPMIMDY